MADLTDAAIEAALERGRTARASEPRAAAARHERASGRIVVDLENRCAFAFPPHLAQGRERASDNQLAAVEILGHGYGLHWEELDVDLSLPGLMAGIFGTRAYMARRAGQAKSTAKTAAAQANGAKGGGRARPRIGDSGSRRT